MTNKRENLLKAGYIKRIHVDQHKIKESIKTGQDLPSLTIQTSQGPIKAKGVYIHGPSVLVQSLDAPISCGARVWLETHAEVTYDG